ncbi:MAG: SGNH/GDSL hydrolase family protein [Deltaproteobacteria bacterium]|nr:SGNH/GDSL hydrolase family protein [Deltaproteobacteria bacterium]
MYISKKRELFILLGIIFICLVGIEMGLRYFPFFAKRSGVFEPKPSRNDLNDIISVFEPNYSGNHISRDFEVNVRTNSLGFREREIDFEKMSLKRPVFFIGDSYFFGWGVEREFRFSERLFNTIQFKIPTVNFSFPGQGTSHYFDMLNMYAKKLNPRLVIIGFFVGNDFLDDQNALRIYTNVDKKLLSGDSIRRFLRESRIINVVKYSLWSIPWFRTIFNKLELRNDRINLFCDENKEIQNLLYSTTFSVLDKISEFSKSNHIPILIVIIPDHLQVINKNIFEEYDIYKPQKKLTGYLKKIDLPYLNLLPYFLNTEDSELYFFKEDKHWTSEGHEFVSKIIIEHLSIKEE